MIDKVNFYSTLDFPPELKEQYVEAFKKVVTTDNLIDGHACREFESEFSSYLGLKYVVGVGNGFDAIRIGLLAMGIKPGDKIAVPAHTFIATWYAVQSVGAIPIGIDVDDRGQIDLDLLEAQTSLACVIPVHMHGTHCDMKRLMKWAQKNQILVLEDCAQAAGLEIQGKKAGSWGDLAAFSFYPTKNLFALGDGGAICTNNSDFQEEARLISRYGSEKENKYKHLRLGQNSRLDTVQAAILSINLKYLDDWNESRSQIAKIYNRDLPNELVLDNMSNSNIFHHYVIETSTRDELRIFLQKHRIGTEIHYPNLAAYECNRQSPERFAVGERISSRRLSLPLSPWQNKFQTDFVIDAIRNFYEKITAIS